MSMGKGMVTVKQLREFLLDPRIPEDAVVAFGRPRGTRENITFIYGWHGANVGIPVLVFTPHCREERTKTKQKGGAA